MTTVLLRCRDADMLGPVCDYITEETPIDEAARDMRVRAETNHEPAITDQDVADMKAFITKDEECSPEECYCSEECCFEDDCC